MRYVAGMKSRLALATIFLVAFGVGAGAEVDKFMRRCNGQLCPYFRLKFTPPNGWVQDEEATRENNMPIYVPKGMDFGSAPALIYIGVTYNRDKRPLEKFVEGELQSWLNEAKDSKIDKIAGEKRASGKADFLIYRFLNPSRPQQAHELMAYGEDTDNDGNSFFLSIGLTAAERKAIDAAEADYRAGLRAH